MAQTIKYIGTNDNWFEVAVTGKQSNWQIGQMEERSDSEAALLLSTGLFETPREPVMASKTVTGGNEISVAGKELFPTMNNLLSARLKKARLALTKQQSGDAPFKVGFITDSTGTGQSASGSTYAGNFALSPCAHVAKMLAARGFTVNEASRFGDNNVGVLTNLAAYDPRVGTVPAAWNGSAQGFSGANFYNGTTTDKFLFTPAGSFQFDRIEVGYLRNTTYDTFSIAVDGGATLLDVNAAGSLSVQVATATCSLGNHTVNIFKKNATATGCNILWIRCYNSASPAIELFNLSAAGAGVAYYTDTSSVYKAGNVIGTAVECDLYIVGLTINDAGANNGGTMTDIPTYKTKLQTLINNCRLSGDVVFQTGTAFTSTGSANHAAVVQAFIEVAAANSIPVIDMFSRWVDWATANADGLITENLHPNKYGYKDIGNCQLPFVVPIF